MKKLILFIALIAGFQCVIAQTKSNFDINKIVIGGSLGGGFSNNYSTLTIAPQVGYQLTPNFTAGVGLNYFYHSLRDSYSAHYFGLNAYGRYTLLNTIILQAQPEINYARFNFRYSPNDTRLVPSFLVGGGLRYGNVYGMLLYDIVQNAYSPYHGIVYSVGFSF